jgi:hypothetical protein
MPGDPKKCRKRAERCIELANASNNANDRRKLTDLAATWVRLADKLERAETITDKTKERHTAK